MIYFRFLNLLRKMSHKLAGILFVLIVANVVNYFANNWLADRIPGWMPPIAVMDGSSLTSTLAFQELQAGKDLLPAGKGLDAIMPAYYRYLHDGKGEHWLAWRQAYDANYATVATTVSAQSGQRWRTQLLTTLGRTALSKYASLFLLALTILLLVGKFLRPQHWWTPLYYLFLMAATAAIYTAFAAPFFTALVSIGFLIYALGLRISLPIYTYEWTKTLRPFLSFLFFLLAMMSIRGPEWVDYLFWTSPLYRLAYISMLGLALFFHWSLLEQQLKNARLDIYGRVLGYSVPLGFTAIALGLVLGFSQYGGENSLRLLNRELLLFSPEIAATFPINQVFVLFFAGVVLLIGGGIGYSIQRIAR